jgi:hypothetical protein
MAGCVKEYIVRLNITMDNVLRMQVTETFARLGADSDGVRSILDGMDSPRNIYSISGPPPECYSQ